MAASAPFALSTISSVSSISFWDHGTLPQPCPSSEKEMVEKVSKAFARTIVVLNVGNIIDMKWVKECKSDVDILFVLIAGQIAEAALGRIVLDILCNRVR